MDVERVASPFRRRSVAWTRPIPRSIPRSILAFALAAVASGFTHAGEAPLRLISAAVPGGSGDIAARVFGDGLARELGTAVIVDARPGGSGLVAISELERADATSPALLVAPNAIVSEIPHVVKAAAAAARRVAPLMEIARSALVLVGAPSLPAATIRELVSYARARPGKLTIASFSTGTVSHILGLQLNDAASIQLVHVPYKGSPPALQDVAGGNVTLMFDAFPSALQYLRQGRLKAFAVTASTRSEDLPDVPTFAELGYPQLTAYAWLALWGRPDMPEASSERIRSAALRAVDREDVRRRFKALGLLAPTGDAPETLRRTLDAEYERTGTLLRASGITPE